MGVLRTVEMRGHFFRMLLQVLLSVMIMTIIKFYSHYGDIYGDDE